MSQIWMRLVSHVWMSHVTHMNESCHMYEHIMSHMWARHVTRRIVSSQRMNASRRTCKYVMSLAVMSHATHTNESWVTLGRAPTWNTQMRHTTYATASCNYTCGMTWIPNTGGYLYIYIYIYIKKCGTLVPMWQNKTRHTTHVTNLDVLCHM